MTVDSAAARPLEVVARAVDLEQPKAKEERTVQPKAPAAKAEPVKPPRRKQTLYLDLDLRRKLKVSAAEQDCELSDLANQALRRFFDM